MRRATVTRILTGAATRILLGVGLGVGVTACAGDPDAAEQILRVSVSNDGEAVQAVWDRVGAAFEETHPGWQVQVVTQEVNLYLNVGLQGQLTGRTPPDIYLEWSGAGLARKVREGYATDLTEFLRTSRLDRRFPAASLESAKVNGQVFMAPFTADVSSVIWYNKDLFAEVGVEPPRTWEELETIARRFRQAGVVPFAVGNKERWVAGNWLAHLISRVGGEPALAATLSGRAPMTGDAMLAGMQYVERLHDSGAVNASANTLSDAEGETLFFQGRAAMLPMGAWIVGIQKEQAPDLRMGWFNLPPVAGGAGSQDSVLAVITGLVLNAHSAHRQEAEQFLEIVYSPEMTQAWIDAELSAVIRSGADGDRSPLSRDMARLLDSGAPLVPPPDTGYDVTVADEFYTAIAQVLDGVKSPQEALQEAQDRLEVRREHGGGGP